MDTIKKEYKIKEDTKKKLTLYLKKNELQYNDRKKEKPL